MFVTYKLSEKSFNKLQKKGLSEAALNDLAELKSRVFPSPEIFLNRVRKLPQAEEMIDDFIAVCEIEAAKLEITVDYYIAEFVV